MEWKPVRSEDATSSVFQYMYVTCNTVRHGMVWWGMVRYGIYYNYWQRKPYDDKESSPSTAGAKTSEDSDNENDDSDDDEDNGWWRQQFIKVKVSGFKFDDLEKFVSIFRHQLFVEFHYTTNDQQNEAQNLQNVSF
jgi:hypothetical protein